MAWREWGNTPINSTSAPASNPTTSTLIAELDSTQLGTQNFVTGQSRLFLVTWILGADTNATWQCETATSTALNAGIDAIYPKTPTAQSGQYVTTHVLGPNYRIRARVNSTFTASASAYISAEPLT